MSIDAHKVVDYLKEHFNQSDVAIAAAVITGHTSYEGISKSR